jgi:hypothetical protein
VIAYKVLRRDGTGLFTRFRWPPGEWVEAEVDPCRRGIHACRTSDLPHWLRGSLCEIELDGEPLEHLTKLVAPRGRLLGRIDAWDEDAERAYCEWCVERGREIVREHPEVARWGEMISAQAPEGPPLVGFMVARTAEQAGGPDAYHAERARQAAWLVERLSLRH